MILPAFQSESTLLKRNKGCSEALEILWERFLCIQLDVVEERVAFLSIGGRSHELMVRDYPAQCFAAWESIQNTLQVLSPLLDKILRL